MEFALIPILLVYPVSACFGGFGGIGGFGGQGCCSPPQQGCGGSACGAGGFIPPPLPPLPVPQPGCGCGFPPPPLPLPLPPPLPLLPPSPICCPQPQPQGCASSCGFGGGGGQAIGGGYVASPTYTGGGGGGGYQKSGSYAAPLPFALPQAAPGSSYNAGPQAAPGSSYNAGPQAAPAPFYGGASQAAPAPFYSGAPQAAAPPPPTLVSTSYAHQQSQQYKDSTLDDGSQQLSLPPENPPVPRRFAEGVEQGSLQGVESEKNDGGEDGQASQVQISTVQPKPISIQRRSFKRKLQF